LQPALSREAGAEHGETAIPWHRWGPYLPEREWGTVASLV
jgi:hypothetical protein